MRASPSALDSARPVSTSISSERDSIPSRWRLAAQRDTWKSRSARIPTQQTGVVSDRSPGAIVSGNSAEGRAAPTAVGRSVFFSSEPR